MDEAAIEQALARMVETADALPGTFSAEFGLFYSGGRTEAFRWACDVEADIWGQTVRVWAETPQQAIDRAIAEAWRRVPSKTNPEHEVVIPSEWYENDALLLASLLLADKGSGADLAGALGRTRTTGTRDRFLGRSELGWALFRLIDGGLVTQRADLLEPAALARRLWAQALEGSTSTHPRAAARNLLHVMQTGLPGPPTDFATAFKRHTKLTEVQYLELLRSYLNRSLDRDQT